MKTIHVIGAGIAGQEAFGIQALETIREADLLCVSKNRILFPRTRYENSGVLDVLLDRADASDIAVVMVGGQVVVRDGVVTTIDEAAVVDRISELSEELYRPTPEASRRRELAALMTPEIEALCEGWYSQPIERPAAIYNTRTKATS